LATGQSPQQMPTGPKPSWVKTITLGGEPSELQAQEASDGYVIHLKDYQTHFGEQTNYYHFIRKIYSEVGVQNGSEIEFTYDPSYQKLIFHEIRIIRDGKSINQLNPGKFKLIQQETSKESHLYDESLTALFILEDVRAGDLVEYSLSCVGINPIYKDKYFTAFYLQNYDPLERLYIRVIAPEQKKLGITYIQTSAKPLIFNQGNQTVYEWDLSQVPGLAVDAEVPSGYDPYPRVWLSEFRSWSEVKDWAMKLYLPAVGKGLVEKKAAEIKSAFLSPEKRLEASLRFVQDEIRYTGLESGISGYKPQAPDKVIGQRFGDCKDKSLLLCSLLKQLGIEAYPALVNTQARSYIQSWAPSPVAFNHCIVQVLLEGKVYWYDPTIANQRGTYNTIYCPNYKKALVIKNETHDLTDIPASDRAKIEVKEHFKVDSIGGKVELSIETKYIGYEADGQRYYFANSNLKEIEKGYVNYYAKHYPKIKVNKPLFSSDNGEQNEFTTYENYEIENFFYPPDSSKPENLECLTFPQSLRDKIFIPKNPIRTMPIGLTYPTHYEHITKIYMPEALNIEPEKRTIEDSLTSFTREISYDDQVVSIHYTYQTFTDQVAHNQIAAYTKSQNQVIDLLGYGLTYTYAPDDAGKDSFRLNGMLALLTVLFLIISGYSMSRLYYYDPQPQNVLQNAEEIGGWMVLFAIGLVFTPLRILWTIIDNDFFNLLTWETLAYSGSASYNPGLVALIIAELFCNTILLVLTVLMIILFFGRRSSFPILVNFFYGFGIIFILSDAVLANMMNGTSEKDNWQVVVDSLRLMISAAIWVPYFHLSKRVKRTFVQTLKSSAEVTRIYRMKV
jgi:hypothetical protein